MKNLKILQKEKQKVQKREKITRKKTRRKEPVKRKK